MDANWWNQALESYDVGRAHRADRENADAFANGGYDAVEQAAGRRGDLQTATSVRRFQDARHEQAFQWFTKNAPYARNVLRAARNTQDPQKRSAFLQNQRGRFESMGFQPEQIDQAIQALTNPDTAEQAFTEYDAAFSQYEDPNWQLVQTDQGQQAAAIDPSSGHITLGDNALPSATGRMATAEEAVALGFQPGTAVWLAPGQPPRPLQNPHYGRPGAAAPGDDDWEAF